jgi:hypothetical protein
MTVRKLIEIVVLAALGAALAAAPAAATVPGGNLLANPEAEAPPSLDPNGIYSPPQGWVAAVSDPDTDQGPFDSCYGGADGETEALESGVGAAIGGGARYFFAGYNQQATLEQEVPVPPEAGGRTLLIGGDFGGWEGQEDHATLEARFFDSGGAAELGLPLATAAVSAADRGYATAMLPRQASGTVPAGTGLIRFVLIQTREEGTSNDGYADNLYATFDGAAPARPAPQGDPACPLAQPAPPSPPAPAASPSPVVTITSGPARESAEAKAVFTFAGTPGGSFECSLDGRPWRPCASGRDFGPVAPGDHRFQVRETLAGKTSAPASYRWTVDLPKACVLRVARARVFAFSKRSKARLVIHYTSYRPARVRVAYALAGRKGKLTLGSAAARFRRAGVFRLPVRLKAAQLAKLRAARSFTVRFKIAGAPGSCGRYYKKRLTIPKRVSGQTVWFQSDSRFAPGS